MPSPNRAFHSLEDFLASTQTHVDAVLDDGSGVGFPLKGREIEATVLFADISGFSGRTVGLTPVTTLIFVQNFFSWITGEALDGRPGIVDKYIGDEVMVVFSKEFGSEDPLNDAVQAAAAMSARDVHSYQPHIGIASGPVIVGYAGTSMRYDVSVFGAPVALAARCAAVRPRTDEIVVSSSIVLPAIEWGTREIDDVVSRRDSGATDLAPGRFDLQDERVVSMKNLGDIAVREIWNTGLWLPTQSAEHRAEEALNSVLRAGRYWPAAE
jgi:class 3 adenylate cyclase